MTAIEWLIEKIEWHTGLEYLYEEDYVIKAKEIEKQNTENKAIHFAEWLTNKHTLELMRLYEHFEEQFYTDEQRS